MVQVARPVGVAVTEPILAVVENLDDLHHRTARLDLDAAPKYRSELGGLKLLVQKGTVCDPQAAAFALKHVLSASAGKGPNQMNVGQPCRRYRFLAGATNGEGAFWVQAGGVPVGVSVTS